MLFNSPLSCSKPRVASARFPCVQYRPSKRTFEVSTHARVREKQQPTLYRTTEHFAPAVLGLWSWSCNLAGGLAAVPPCNHATWDASRVCGWLCGAELQVAGGSFPVRTLAPPIRSEGVSTRSPSVHTSQTPLRLQVARNILEVFQTIARTSKCQRRTARRPVEPRRRICYQTYCNCL